MKVIKGFFIHSLLLSPKTKAKKLLSAMEGSFFVWWGDSLSLVVGKIGRVFIDFILKFR